MRINVNPVVAGLVMPAIVVLFSASAMAQDSAADCADIQNDRERLACFDRVFSDAADNAGAARDSRAAGGAAESVTDSAEASRANRRSSSAGGAGNSTPARSAAPARTTAERERRSTRGASRDRRSEAETEPNKDRFGLEHEVFDLGGEERRSKAVGQFGFWERGQRVELENGQVWQVVDDDELYYKVTNPEVTIEKGLLGSHYLHLDGISKSVKVKRIR